MILGEVLIELVRDRIDYYLLSCVISGFCRWLQNNMVNSNPETVSTDYDTSDILYFEPVTLEDVLNIIEAENPYGLIVQFGGKLH